MKKEVRRWLEQAEEELDTAKVNFKAKKYFSAAFWCQQAVEKALKALLIDEEGDFPKVHDLTKLAKLVKAPNRILESCAMITPAYTASRYPDVFKKYSKDECGKLMQYCEEVLQ